MKLSDLDIVLFDLDGVLSNTSDIHKNAFCRAGLQYGVHVSDELYYRELDGLSTKSKLKKLNIADEICVNGISLLKQQYTYEAIEDSREWISDKSELLIYLASNGVMSACVTNCSIDIARLILNKCNCLDYLEFIISNTDTKKTKPYPDQYNLAIEVSGADPEKCLCVEDSEIGVCAAMQSRAKYLWKVASSSEVSLSNFLSYINIL